MKSFSKVVYSDPDPDPRSVWCVPYTEGPCLTRILGLGKKPCYMKLVSVGLYCGPLLMLIHYLHVHKPKNVLVETVLVIFI